MCTLNTRIRWTPFPFYPFPLSPLPTFPTLSPTPRQLTHQLIPPFNPSSSPSLIWLSFPYYDVAYKDFGSSWNSYLTPLVLAWTYLTHYFIWLKYSLEIYTFDGYWIVIGSQSSQDLIPISEDLSVLLENKCYEIEKLILTWARGKPAGDLR